MPASTLSATPASTRRELEGLLGAALAGGADLSSSATSTRRTLPCAPPPACFRDAAADAGALFILNDRPELATDLGADGVHVGQDDTPVAAARELAGEGALVGLSTHAPEQLDAALDAAGPSAPTISASARSGRRRRSRAGPRRASKPIEPAGCRPARRRPGLRSARSMRAQSRQCARLARADRRRPRNPRCGRAACRRPRAARGHHRAGRGTRVSSRERKRSERRKRKQRSASRAAEPAAPVANGDEPGGEAVSDIAAERRRGASPNRRSATSAPGGTRAARGGRAPHGRHRRCAPLRRDCSGLARGWIAVVAPRSTASDRTRSRSSLRRSSSASWPGHVGCALLGRARLPGGDGDPHGRLVPGLISAASVAGALTAVLILAIAGASSGSRSRRWRGSRCRGRHAEGMSRPAGAPHKVAPMAEDPMT